MANISSFSIWYASCLLPHRNLQYNIHHPGFTNQALLNAYWASLVPEGLVAGMIPIPDESGGLPPHFYVFLRAHHNPTVNKPSWPQTDGRYHLHFARFHPQCFGDKLHRRPAKT
ncbi:hypothetical protein NPIL_75421 [Nephila pilipes]|uniref:Uncharacterized protein n=1 Tax=Nephila pilipes TaxID=299642 RepID=A0A8X6N4V3_NEPPI|nr:hypothetical protein NPIL_75421 [Nephila pilipes]